MLTFNLFKLITLISTWLIQKQTQKDKTIFDIYDNTVIIIFHNNYNFIIE